MYAFSLLVIAGTVLNLCFNKAKKKALIVQTGITIFICSFVNVGYFFESELINVDYYQGAIILNFIVAVLSKRHRSVVTKSCFRYIACLLVSVVLLIVIPSTSANVTGLSVPRFEYYMTGQLPFSHPIFSKFSVFYLIIAICMAFIVDTIGQSFTREDWIQTLRIVAKLGKVLLVIVCFEIVVKYILGSNMYSSFIVGVFGEGTSTYLTLVSRGSFRMLQGLTREASHFAYGMMLLVILLFTDGKIEVRKNAVWISIAILALVLSGAFSMILSIAFLASYYLVVATYYNSNREGGLSKKAAVFALNLAIVLFLVGTAGVVLIQTNDYIASRLYEVFEVIGGLGKNGVGYYSTLSHVTSSQTRLFSLYYTFREWLKRPLFGLGLGTTFCYSNTVLTLAETGLVTAVSMWLFFINVMKKYCVNLTPCKISLALWILCNFLSGIQSRLIVAADVLIVIGCCIVLFSYDFMEVSNRTDSNNFFEGRKL